MAGLAHPVLLSTFVGMDSITIGGQEVVFSHVFYSWVCMAILFTTAWILKKRLTLVPGKLQNFWEAVIDTLDKFIVNTMGEKNGPKYVPFLSCVFIYIITSNLMGLIPGLDAPTANLNTTVSMALFVFVLYHVIGISVWHHKYIKQFLGISKWLIPLMFPLEVFSHLARPVSLSLRLFGNIKGEEIVLILFFIMAPILGTIPVYALFLLATCMQALVCFMLTMLSVRGALDGHEH